MVSEGFHENPGKVSARCVQGVYLVSGRCLLGSDMYLEVVLTCLI